MGIITRNKDVSIQDQTSAPIAAYFSLLEQETTLTAPTAIGDNTINVADATGIIAGKYITVFDVASNRYYLGVAISVSVLEITLDRQLDFAFPSGANVSVSSRELNVDGSITPKIFGLRNTEEVIGVSFDITRVIFSALCDTPADLSKFGDLAPLTFGLTMRSKNGIYKNIFNVKTNDELASLMYDFDIFSATNPAQGQDGFKGRLTFAGQEKFGVALRIEPGDDLQIIVQDDLSDLLKFNIIVEGHEVEY